LLILSFELFLTMKPTKGRPYPIGSTAEPDGVNFSLFSNGATKVELLFFDHAEDGQPSFVFELDPLLNRTFHYWHIKIEGAKPGQLYGYRVDGPQGDPSRFRFDAEKLLLDPYTQIIVPPKSYSRQKAKVSGDNLAFAPKCMVASAKSYDWQGDSPLVRPNNRTYIYELHIAGFTKDPSSGLSAQKRGTFLGLIEKIPYLKELGITAVELLPVQQFDPQDAPAGLSNYWGYSPMGFFALHSDYCVSEDPLDWADEFKDMVKELHKAGIEVIMDVVFNHTCENGNDGPTLSFKGLANKTYYITKPGGEYLNFSGCGNSLNANHSVVRRLILDCLHYWVREMHVDGFRFDLASSLARDESGNPLENPPILWAIESDPILAGTKIIAEAWDAGGLYQMGKFIGDRWAEWNDKFRDDWREFWRGDFGKVIPIQNRLTGSKDIFGKVNFVPTRSINFITCHDGFTLHDLVSYNHKHNYANGENNRDGHPVNLSWNCGVEGETDDPDIIRLRKQQAKNFLISLLLSQGTPMLLMGDEIFRTQKGNNNAYCQNNELSWMNWSAVENYKGILLFCKKILKFTQSTPVFSQAAYWLSEPSSDKAFLVWHGIEPNQPDTSYHSRSIAFQLFCPQSQEQFYVILNAFNQDLRFNLPAAKWKRIIDTSKPSPEEFDEIGQEVEQDFYRSRPYSTVLLKASWLRD
jgi:glycogen operon protein